MPLISGPHFVGGPVTSNVRAQRPLVAAESAFVAVAMNVARRVLPQPLSIHRGAALLYQVTVDNNLSTTVNVKNPRAW